MLRKIGTLSRCIRYINDLKFEEIDLKKGQFEILTRICENQGINQIDLSNLLKVDKSATARSIQKLIEAGYIDRKKDDVDQRMWRIYPKKKALDKYEFIIEEENRNTDVCFNNFSMEEKELISKLIKRLSENIENCWKEIKGIYD